MCVCLFVLLLLLLLLLLLRANSSWSQTAVDDAVLLTNVPTALFPRQTRRLRWTKTQTRREARRFDTSPPNR